MRYLLLLLLMALPAAARAQTAASPQIMLDVKAGNFTDANTLAEQTGDPLMVKLVSYYQLLGGGSADELQAFISANPDWPQQGLLALRLAQANGTATPRTSPVTPPFLAQVEALHDAGNDSAAASLWIAQGKAAAAAAAPDSQLLFWPDQNSLARALLMAGDAKNAYAVVIAAAPRTNRRPRLFRRFPAPSLFETTG
jgi:hypothetical protein